MPGNEEDNARRIRILSSIAYFLYNEGRAIFIAGTGEDIHGAEVTNVASEIETIPAEIPGFRWANAAARFIRYAMQVLQLALQEEHDAQSRFLLGEIDQNLETIFEDENQGTT